MTDDYLSRIGNLIRDARKHRGWTQAELAEQLGTSQSAVNRIERGHQNLSLEMLARIGEALDSEIVSLGAAGPMHLRVVGGTRLSGTIDVKTSKNAGVALLCASLLNKGRTMLRRVARIEEVNRILEVLDSHRREDLLAQRRQRPRDRAAGAAGPRPASTRRRRAVPAASSCSSARCCTREDTFELPYAGGCDLGTRTVEPHMTALRRFGLEVKATEGSYHATRRPRRRADPADRADRARRHRHRERAAGRRPARRRHRHPQRQPQLHGPGPVLLPGRARRADRRHRHHHAHRARRQRHRRRRRLLPVGGPDRGDEPAGGRHRHRVRRSPSAGCRSSSWRSSWRCWRRWACRYDRTEEYLADNGHTRLVDLTTRPSMLQAPIDKIHPMPFPGPQHRQPARSSRSSRRPRTGRP